MYRHGLFSRLLLVVVLVGGLVLGASTLYRSGWTQGYQIGLLTAASSEGKSTLPALPYLGGYPGGFYPGYGSPFGVFLGIGAFLVLIFLIGAAFRFWGWRHWARQGAHDGPEQESWRAGAMPPWAREWKEWKEWKESRQSKPPADEPAESPQSE